ncbi:hypothetical protein N0V93_001416 [Gnomoniopsis smithogilvyi]|uniref:Ankyrin n=1 Tax=Gnomoniopsis smithogilvyi TaxID=1191159 RepID=A0A9W8Z1L8_9PEZI|nr:hypothetical protein N0V93_001416 [Gnomoniopsis smithogilvyi]
MLAQVETIRLLLRNPWRTDFGDVHARDRSGYSPILLAAECCGTAGLRTSEDDDKALEDLQTTTSRAEETILILLAHGASARDVVLRGIEVQATILSLAVANACAALVRRLLEEGADGGAKLTHDLDDRGSAIPYANAGAVQALLDALPVTNIPFSGPSEGVTQRIADTFQKLPLSIADNTSAVVNAQDQQGDTPLHYAARKRRPKNSSEDVALATAQLLCKHGADASIRGRNRGTPLHGTGWLMREGEPVDTILLDILLAHGASTTAAGPCCTGRPGTWPTPTSRDTCFASAARMSAPWTVVAADGVVRGGGSSGAQTGLLAAEDRIRVQTDMMAALVEGLSAEEADSLLDRPDDEGKTPRQLCRAKQDVWRGEEEARRNRAMGLSDDLYHRL